MKIKKILALAVALTSVFAVAGCGSTGDSSSKVSTVKKVKVEDTQEIEAIPDDAQKTIRWMVHMTLILTRKRARISPLR